MNKGNITVEAGNHDREFCPVQLQIETPKGGKESKRVYQLLGVPNKVDLDIFDGAHRFSGRKAFNWFDRWL